MKTDLSTSGDFQKSYGKARPNRGANHVDSALAFIREYPIGTPLSQDEFSEWAQRNGLLLIPVGYPKHSDAWKAYCQRRHELRYSINKAGAHPRMREDGSTPFVIEAVKLGYLEVRSPEVAISRNQITKSLVSLCETKKKNLGYLMQSADWDVLPPYEKMFAESLYDDIDMFQDSIALHTRSLERKFGQLESKLRKAVESGQLQPKNHGIKRLIAPESSDDDQVEDES